MNAKNSLKVKRFIDQYDSKSVWQIDSVLTKLIEEIVKDEVNTRLEDAKYSIEGRKIS